MSLMLNLCRRLMYTNIASNQSRKKIDFFYDVLSPYSWFAFEVLQRYKNRWDVDIILQPMFLAGVTHATNNSAPMLVPAKGAYMLQDLIRCAKYFNVPLNIIQDPFEVIMKKGSLVPNRFLTAVNKLYPDSLAPVSRALWMALWSRDEDFTSPVILQKAAQEAGLSADQIKNIHNMMSSQEIKDQLKETTNQAVDYGAFGSPTLVAHNGTEPMVFFGSDRFPVLAYTMELQWSGPEPDKANL